MIKYGIGKDYVPDWTVKEALREIVQNFRDYGDYDTKKSIDGTTVKISMSNTYSPQDFSFMRVGMSDKRNSDTTVGEHGEGLILALLVLKREGYSIAITTPKARLTPAFYEDEYLGTCLGVNIDKGVWTRSGFGIRFTCHESDWFEFEDSVIDDEDVIFKYHYGSIVKKPAGDIYVGGLFVLNMNNIAYAYDFKPETVSLDRDRKIPSFFDVTYYGSAIADAWGKFKVADVLKDDFRYSQKLPKSISNTLDVKRVGKEIVLTSGDTILPDRYFVNAVNGNKSLAKKVVKLKFSISKKRKPETILREWLDTYKANIATEAILDFEVLINKAKNWS